MFDQQDAVKSVSDSGGHVAVCRAWLYIFNTKDLKVLFICIKKEKSSWQICRQQDAKLINSEA